MSALQRVPQRSEDCLKLQTLTAQGCRAPVTPVWHRPKRSVDRPRVLLSHNLNIHESAEELQIFYIVTVYDDDVLAGNGLLIMLHIHAGL